MKFLQDCASLHRARERESTSDIFFTVTRHEEKIDPYNLDPNFLHCYFIFHLDLGEKYGFELFQPIHIKLTVTERICKRINLKIHTRSRREIL